MMLFQYITLVRDRCALETFVAWRNREAETELNGDCSTSIIAGRSVGSCRVMEGRSLRIVWKQFFEDSKYASALRRNRNGSRYYTREPRSSREFKVRASHVRQA